MTLYQTLTFEQQLDELAKLADQQFIQQNKNVKGPYTSGDYVEWQLRRIFGPHAFSVEIREPAHLVEISARESYAQTTVRLTATFANGSTTFQDALGIWPFRATNAGDGGTLEDTASERYETVLKAAVTDAVKAAAERIGSCFRPITDERVRVAISRAEFLATHDKMSPEQIAKGKAALFGEPERAESPAPTAPGAPAPEKPTNGKAEADVHKMAEIKGHIPEWQKSCIGFAKKFPSYQTTAKGKPSGQPNYMHILKAASLEGYPHITPENYEIVIEALYKRAAKKSESA